MAPAMWLSQAIRAPLQGIYEKDYRGYRERTGSRVKKKFATAALRLAAMLTLGLLVIFAVLLSDYTVALEVRVNGTTVGYVENEAAMLTAASSVERYVEKFLGRSYSLTESMDYNLAVVQKDVPEAPEQLNSTLLAGVTGIKKLYRLEVDGEVVAAANTKETISAVLDRILSGYIEEGTDTQAAFSEELSITYADTDTSLRKTEDELYALLCDEIDAPLTYLVVEGDTVASVATKFAIEPEALRAYNDMAEGEELTAGETIIRKAANTYLTVEVTRTVVLQQAIPFAETVQEDPAQETDYSAILTQGVDGTAEVTQRVTYVSGHAMEVTELSRTVVTPAVEQVKVVGTKEPLVTGTYSSPFPGGIISSRYGMRSKYEFHTGLDLAGSYGSRILAADGGVVTYAGWKGNYGKLVIVQHADGVETWYAHCSAYLVSVGDEVQQGEAIAKLGSTGRSTGPHVHFEIRINGETIDPESVLTGLY